MQGHPDDTSGHHSTDGLKPQNVVYSQQHRAGEGGGRGGRDVSDTLPLIRSEIYPGVRAGIRKGLTAKAGRGQSIHEFYRQIKQSQMSQMNCESRTQPMDWGGKIWIVGCMYAKSCPTLCDPMARSPPGSSVHGILQANVLEWVAISSSRGSSQPRDQTQVFYIAGRFITI